MKNSDFNTHEKTVIRRSLRLLAPLTVFGATLLLGTSSFAETFHFRVAFASVPGIEEIEAGNLPLGIKVLEDQLARSELESSGDVLTTLCAAYIVNRSLDKAARACDEAVAIDPTESAYNNRGVFRAHTGDLPGARADFERARPRQLEAYMEQLRMKNVPLMAADNFDLVDELLSKRTAAQLNGPAAMGSAAIEDLSD